MEINFRYFWRNFDKNNNIFRDLIKDSQSSLPADLVIEFHSVFTRPRRFYNLYIVWQLKVRKLFYFISGKKVIYIWYTGENIEPPKGYHLTLSFKEGTKHNIYWPLWATYVDIKTKNNKYDRDFIFDQKKMICHRDVTISAKNNKACAFISNDVDWRFNIARKLEVMGLLDIYGRAVNKFVENKREIAEQYLFQFCFENVISNGYVTEKVFESWECHNIPIFYGGNDMNYLNSDAIIDCRNVDEEAMVNYIQKQMIECININNKSEKPILLKMFNHDVLIQKIRELCF